jgi:murein DD-endopeptidase MepM/ murein hydrolase activator NlpD
MTPEMAAGVDVAPSNGERSHPGDRHRCFLAQRLRQLRSTARLKMRCCAVWSVMPVTVILVVGAEAAGVSARDGRLVPGGDSIAEAATHRTAPAHLTRPDGREETLAALRFRWPVYGPISSDFGAPRPSRTGFHAGVDIGASRGTFVRAPAGGTVAFVGWRSGYGRTIVIDHGDQISTVYGHLAKPDVIRGQTVEEGAGIGLIGATGHASGPHLHYEVLVNGRPVNPRLVFARPQDIDGRSRVAARENPSGQREARSIPSSTDAASSWQRWRRVTLPQSPHTPEFAAAGGLISYGNSLADAYRLEGNDAGRLLKGERPAELPVQQSVKTELVIKTAKALGLTIPQTLLQRADQIIE